MLVGLLAAALLPAAVAAAELRELFELEYAAAAIPGAFLGGMLAVVLARRARLRTERTIGRVGGRVTAALGRTLGILAILLALAGAIAIGTYVFLARFANEAPGL